MECKRSEPQSLEQSVVNMSTTKDPFMKRGGTVILISSTLLTHLSRGPVAVARTTRARRRFSASFSNSPDISFLVIGSECDELCLAQSLGLDLDLFRSRRL